MANSIIGLIEEAKALDKNETKNIAIIMLTVFLAFSVIINVYYYVETQAERSNNDLAASGRYHLPPYGFSSFESQNDENTPLGSFLLRAV